MSELKGKRIAIAADRRSDAIGEIIHKKGGTYVVQSIQGEMILNEKEAENDVIQFIEDDSIEWVILTTGIGAKALEEAAARIGRVEEYIEKLRNVHLAIRGSKTINWMKTWELEPTLTAPDGTMETLIKGFAEFETKNGCFFLQEYNKEEEVFIKQLKELSSSLYRSQPYHYHYPNEDILTEARQLVANHEIDAIVFTSKTQVKNLFLSKNERKPLVNAFQQAVLAVAIGKVTAQELESYGVTRILQPDKPKMGAMVISIANYFKPKDS
ncbi:uroporphyrinogen-III synthase [Aquibacillus kalidii]|uniref:uroporphyrinogen-III synthase n=1 Tax=Aquibacillus kalidii TaxID=2762597 RepID=UPI00164976B5|nr:uroporphyrinogen-III synthase [Aquibacillus kalidii]